MGALPELPLAEWADTKDTLHLWVQIVGKVRLASTPPRNHWWHVPLYLDVRGLTTRRMHAGAVSFELAFDFVDHRLVVRTSRGEVESFGLADGLSVAAFDRRLHETLAGLGLDVTIREVPYRVPWTTTPFPDDHEHARYDRDAVERFWRILDWSDGMLELFSGWYCGKTSPVHLFWHGLDLAVTRFSGRRAPEVPDAGPVDREAYSHEVVSFGFWAGDRELGEPMYYSYTAPEPEGLRDRPLRPDEARWRGYGNGSLALLPYETVRASTDPERTLLAFLESAYRAGADAAGWDRAGLASSFCPDPPALLELLAVKVA